MFHATLYVTIIAESARFLAFQIYSPPPTPLALFCGSTLIYIEPKFQYSILIRIIPEAFEHCVGLFFGLLMVRGVALQGVSPYRIHDYECGLLPVSNLEINLCFMNTCLGFAQFFPSAEGSKEERTEVAGFFQ